MTDFQTKLRQILPDGDIMAGELMSRHTTFKVGGPADFYVTPECSVQLAEIAGACAEFDIPYFILGNGSNILITDKGFRGVAISTKKLNSLEVLDNNKIQAGAGVMLYDAAAFCLEHGLGGLEFASGIPGSVGGAVFMNAGAYGGEIKDVFVSAEVLDRSGRFFMLRLEEMDFSYRKSRAQNYGLVVLSAVFQMKPEEASGIKRTMGDLAARRGDKQPLEMASAGSTFKRPEGYFAGKLIMDSGLRGYAIGGAQVSEKHCGFVVNKGNATARDILDLIEYVIQTVRERQGVTLEPEVRVIGEP